VGSAPPALARRALAEFVGTALLLAAIVGSGIAAQRLSPHDIGLQLLENAAATATALAAIIAALGPVSGAHLNPAVTLADGLLGGMRWTEGVVYGASQAAGAAAGTVVANLMYALPAVTISARPRSGPGLWIGEVVATFGLVLVIFGTVRTGRQSATPWAVGAFIAGAYWFTSSTSFANPAVSIARTLTDTFAGIAPASVPRFILAEAAGCLLGVAAVRTLYPLSDRGRARPSPNGKEGRIDINVAP